MNMDRVLHYAGQAVKIAMDDRLDPPVYVDITSFEEWFRDGYKSGLVHDCRIFVIKTVRTWINQNVQVIDDNFDVALAMIHIVSQSFKYGMEKRANDYKTDLDLAPRKVR
ncbi:hypothetical protein Fot_22978 [Forsythia ovata]|uniref:Uncharacterized protein n=1 Tax=Forsythia ovata TaxID=205694 RepID=A0ABD1UZK4_9LAMI